MPLSGTNSQIEVHPRTQPLFRPEALAAQEKLHGEVLLIRPFPVAFFVCLVAAVGAVVLGFLVTGHYTEEARVSATLVSNRFSASSPAGHDQLEAVFNLPKPLMHAVHPGQAVTLRSPGGHGPGRGLTGTVLQISLVRPGADAAEGTSRVAIALPPEASQWFTQTSSAQRDGKFEMEILLGRKPLLRWLLEHGEL
jgi:hypothetical protein